MLHGRMLKQTKTRVKISPQILSIMLSSFCEKFNMFDMCTEICGTLTSGRWVVIHFFNHACIGVEFMRCEVTGRFVRVTEQTWFGLMANCLGYIPVCLGICCHYLLASLIMD